MRKKDWLPNEVNRGARQINVNHDENLLKFFIQESIDLGSILIMCFTHSKLNKKSDWNPNDLKILEKNSHENFNVVKKTGKNNDFYWFSHSIDSSKQHKLLNVLLYSNFFSENKNGIRWHYQKRYIYIYTHATQHSHVTKKKEINLYIIVYSAG